MQRDQDDLQVESDRPQFLFSFRPYGCELDNDVISDDMLLNRLELSRKLYELNQSNLKDAAQKAKVKWVIQGDENSKFFHGIINKRRAQLAIQGVFDKGVWLTDPPLDCGENKSPGPDGFTFIFFRHIWDLIGSDLCVAFNCFFDSGSFPRGCNSSFISLIPKVMDAKFVTDFRPTSLIGSVYKVIRQILDGLFILNEALAWGKRMKKQALMFKVDFAMAYDFVRCDFLLDTLHAFGFGSRWCLWIHGIFSSSMASILVNGSPTREWPDDNLANLVRWSCDLNGEGMFRVKDIRLVLDDLFLPSSNEATRWAKYVSIKVNVFA
nr:RNA-directed DNA polymerase, eukaryota, reverse transcriptase zinc-binding domain protein [Tanacetum cinerariifolium]